MPAVPGSWSVTELRGRCDKAFSRDLFCRAFARPAKMRCSIEFSGLETMPGFKSLLCCGYVETTRDELLQLPALSSIVVSDFLACSPLHTTPIYYQVEQYQRMPSPIGSMVLVYMLTWLGYIDGIHVTIYSSTMDPMDPMDHGLIDLSLSGAMMRYDAPLLRWVITAPELLGDSSEVLARIAQGHPGAVQGMGNHGPQTADLF